MLPFDKLGEFFLGNETTETKAPVLLSAKDLTTHAFIVGMTGSGKTGLAVDLLEEALLDDIPVIAIDPKGDLANLALQFGDLNAPEAKPWLELGGKSGDEQRQHWQKIRGYSGIESDRIEHLRDKLVFRVFTPGQADGFPVNTLPLDAASYKDFSDSARDEKANALSVALLTRIGEYKDNQVSPAQVYLAKIFLWHWQNQQPLDLATLLGAVQKPPFDMIGLLDVEIFFPAKDRHALMLKLNGLIASPGFEDWLSGPALDVGTLYQLGGAKVPVTIFSIAHLSEEDRQFFVSLLLAEIIAWMRSQNGSDALRAVLYMDEIFGFIPPIANPPSKTLFLTLLKQARAYGLGLALATQNPVDLDYKGLSNIGTWMIGRLQTKRDRERLLDGLQQLRGDAEDVEKLISELKKREFLLNSVHNSAQPRFYTRCTQSLLVGPLSVAQLKKLPNLVIDQDVKNTQSLANTDGDDAIVEQEALVAGQSSIPPAVNPRIEMRYQSIALAGVYQPVLTVFADIFYEHKESGLQEYQTRTLTVPCNEAGNVDWAAAELSDVDDSVDWQTSPQANIGFAKLPKLLQQLTPYTRSKTVIRKVIQPKSAVDILCYEPLELFAQQGESEATFRARVALAIKENRDVLKEALRAETDQQLSKLNDKMSVLMNRLEREKSESMSAKLTSWVKVGSALLSAFVSTKTISATNASRASSSINAVTRARKQARDVKLVAEDIAELEQEIDLIEQSLAERIQQLEVDQPDLQSIALQSMPVQPKLTDINVAKCFLGWV
jgi:tRNA A37 N6-isopentenylltransferase MiaA